MRIFTKIYDICKVRLRNLKATAKASSTGPGKKQSITFVPCGEGRAKELSEVRVIQPSKMRSGWRGRA